MTLRIWNKFGQMEVLGRHYTSSKEAELELEKRFSLKIRRTLISSNMTTFYFDHPYYVEAELE